jgi:DNA-binding CsgD family transcriptional regulator
LDWQVRIHQMWAELARFGAAEYDEALVHLLTVVSELIDAQNAYWVGTVRLMDRSDDPLLGWRPSRIRYLRELPCDEQFTERRLRDVGQGAIDEPLIAHAQQAGKYRAHRFHDLVSPEWFQGETYQHYLARGVHDSLTVGIPVSSTTETVYGFLRMHPEPFTELERDIAAEAMRGPVRLHRELLLGHGLLVASAPLTPIERSVLTLLLTEKSEKMIAEELSLTPTTLHTYVRDLLKKFGVSGRIGLVALWLGRHPESLASA